ncbi:prolipoprotein diacylglyceryl transferase [Helicobacter bizzozeronii CIII-1]|uniref:Phosphatidylglycerol--prolipoprotein diacylglyceryl transferase n=1 Tax=Helicobacter bizzozeronii (strain CIII-1) TaxID=1002804 RepID=F8KR53_HELBC|nr:prolipoprotein diacylglyceryl transferase [Helicobacter bizzozeronii]CCB79227.1 prolipoprotein diacylglyceryl transferase [Helicobacter bizzozeronii CIII-1]
MSYWNQIYSHFSPIAFSVFGVPVHWYGLAYVTALLLAFLMALRALKSDPKRFPISKANFESYFIYAEVGVILGARLGYILIYDPNTLYYLKAPWQIFNPFHNGEFIGIRGMSYHGGLVGFLIASWLFSVIKKQNFLIYLDLIAISLPLAYVFGRIGNFLNQELFGRAVPSGDTFGQHIGIVVEGVLRYPSQLIEALLEGLVVFGVVCIAKAYTHAHGMLMVVYGLSYALARFVSEYYREADSQLGYYFWHLSMGQILSMLMVLISLALWGFIALRQRHP